MDPHTRAVLAAAMARIIPSDATPGAAEAGCIEWLERYLAGIGAIHALPDGNGFYLLTGREAEAWTARVAAVRERYADGVRELDSLARDAGAADFLGLDAAAQDELLAIMERKGSVERKRTQAAVDEDDLPFFGLLVMHTRQAFYSDPVYGGNRDHLGWKLIGFHGPSSMAEALGDGYTTDAYLA
jgi:gluconate 2-dehydrogenase gamma chain